MKIDIYCHILPAPYKEALYRTGKLPEKQRQTSDSVPIFNDLDYRFRVMDEFEDLRQVLTIAPPALETYLNPREAADIARIANDELAKLVTRYPDRFTAGVAVLPMNDINAALVELERAINELDLKGVQIYTPLNGKPLDTPEYIPLYEKMSEHNLPIWVHPSRGANFADYSVETKTRYEANKVFGWPYETTIAMSRLVFTGIMEKYPKLKIITHHGGGLVPYYEGRIRRFYELNEERGWGDYDPRLPLDPLDYFRKIYADTALDGSGSAMMCAYKFFGAEKLVFGTDMHGADCIRETIKAIETMNIPEPDKQKIFYNNTISLLNMTS